MNIVDVKLFAINPAAGTNTSDAHGKNWVFVKVYTESGISGIGEAFHSLDEPVAGAIEKFKRWLIGKDASRIIHHWQALYRGLRYPPGTATLAALSAVEQALWDIAGKSYGLPIYRMLGGPSREKIRLYASAAMLAGPSLPDAAKAAVDAGFTAIKFVPEWPTDSAGSATRRDAAIQQVEAVRATVGSDVDICLDCHGRHLNPIEAVQFARRVAPYDVLFLEEPVLPDHPAALAEVKTKTRLSIAAGERCVTRTEMRHLISERMVHIVQPEPTANGGILETFKVAAMAEMHQILVAPHHAGSPIALAVCAQIAASIPNFLIQECNVVLESQCVQDVFIHVPHVENGYLSLSDRPGLGVDLNEEAARAYPPVPFDRPVVINTDGSIGFE